MDTIQTIFTFGFEPLEKAESKGEYHIGGYATTQSLDRVGEQVMQKGLDFSDFLKNGWFNYNHSREVVDIVGYPTVAEYRIDKGWYVEGFLIKGYKKAEEIWMLANALQKSNRRLGFSVEGSIQKRTTGKVLKAMVRNVAITHQPINTECTLEVLVKSFCSNFEGECNNCSCKKSLQAGQDIVPVDGGGALRTESLDKNIKYLTEAEVLSVLKGSGFSESQAKLFNQIISNDVVKSKLIGRK